MNHFGRRRKPVHRDVKDGVLTFRDQRMIKDDNSRFGSLWSLIIPFTKTQGPYLLHDYCEQ